MNFYAVNAKISAMRGELLTEGDFDDLCQSGSVEGVGVRLSENGAYRDILKSLEGAEIRRRVLEEKLPLALYSDYERIRLFIYDQKVRDYLSAMFLKFGLNIFKLLLCMVSDERNIPYSLPELDMLFARQFRLNAERLASAATVQALIEELRGTELYSLLSGISSLFEMERQLDLYYYLQLKRKREVLLDKANSEVMERIIGTEIDMLNILWIYRLKHFYKINDERIFAYLIPIYHRLTAEQVNRMTDCESVDELAEVVAAGPYGSVFASGDARPFNRPEAALSRKLNRVCAAEAKKHPDTLAPAVCYIYGKEREINNITTALEGVRYQLDYRRIMEYLY
ncbi:MAG: V-type ATPase subunit [Clostridiales bacterium]|jgi:V/A-type H+-transporting ATPase subunit C|nr:V-type ATPase subunit [Clostridiales bacterium]